MTRRWPLLVLAAICYIPLFFTAPGEVGADTKTYLYLDPARLLSRAASMWDPNIGFGTVTHQNIGYLWPMGPYYWFADVTGIPMWFAQRFWLGSILFLAGAGVWFLLRTLRFDTLPAAVASFAYALTPYTLTLAARLSVILLPFAGMPWMLAFTIRAIRRGGWRDPALFALVVLSVGGVNATALVFAGVAPVLWFPFAIWVTKEATLRRAAGAFVRIGVLTLLTSLWWMAGLSVQSGYGIQILQYTETAAVVASASVAPELLRGLGYWFFYGGDRLGPWIEPSVDYTQRLWLIAVTYLLPTLALLGAAMSRWKHRAYFAVLVLAGLFISVGAHPWDDPPLTGQWWKDLLESDKGLALRSTPRAVPLIALGLAVFLGLGVATLARSAPRFAKPAGFSLVALTVLGLPPLFTGGMVAANLERGDIPQYWFDAISSFDAQPHDTRVLEVPGIDFASYRWGNTVDPITPGLMDRPYAARELIPYGSPPSSDLLNAFDRRLQENTLDPRAVSPIARLLGVGQVVARNDLQFERYRVARPYQVMPLLGSSPGLGSPTGFGPLGTNEPSAIAPLQDEAALRDDTGALYQPVVAFPVEGQQPIVRTASAQQPIIVAGDGEGLVGLASSGLIDGSELVQYAASFAGQPQQLTDAIGRDASLVVTDSNRRRGRRWSTLRDNIGYTEQAGETPLRQDLTDNRLPVFPNATDDSYTVAEYPGGVSARASSYGNPISFTPEFRAANAVDGDPRTSWRTGSSSDVRGEELELDFAQPVNTDHIRVTQLLTGFRNRSITNLDLRFDGKDTVPVVLDQASNTPAGQVLTFPKRTFSKLELIIRNDDSGRENKPLRPERFNGLSEVGFSEVDVDGRHGDEVIRLPKDLLATAGAASLDHPLTLSLERERIDPAESVREDEELALARTWTLPTARTFALTGQARLDTRADEGTIDALLGVVGPTATSTRRLPGDLLARATSAIDGDPATAWSPAFDTAPQGGDALDLNAGRQVTFDHLDLQVVADGRHSVPTHMRIEADGQEVASVPIPAIADRPGTQGAAAATTVPITLPSTVTGTDIRFVFDDVRQITTTDWFSNQPVQMPIAIAEIGVPALQAAVPTGAFDTGCRADLLSVDDTPVDVDITGTVADATSGKPLQVRLCGLSADGIFLDTGDHVLRAAKGLDTGIDLDSLVLQSAAGGGAPPEVGPIEPAPAPGPAVKVNSQGRTSFDLSVSGASPKQPFWVVLGQSNNSGWTASVDGHDLGKPQLVDGYANGWLIDPTSADVKVVLTWTPQRNVWIALGISALGVLLCLVLALRRPRALALQVEEPGPEPITWRTFVRSRGRDEPSVRAAVLTGLAAGIAAAAVIGLIAGAFTALVVGVAAHRRRARWWLALGAPALLALSALYVLVRQAHSKPTPAFEWPAELSAIHQVGWLAVAFLVALVVVDWLWDRVNRRSRSEVAAVASAHSDDVSPPTDGDEPPP
jgi:arabinofuranan 3-O-arabinosyltransferase